MFNENDVVLFSTRGTKGKGIIRGKSAEFPVVGTIYIIEVTESDIDKVIYPYSCITIPEAYLEKQSECSACFDSKEYRVNSKKTIPCPICCKKSLDITE